MHSTPNERIFRYELQETANQLYRNEGVEWNVQSLISCGKYSPKKELLFKITNDGTIYFSGNNHCNCRASCPVCSYPMQLKTLNEIQYAVWKARKMGYGVYLITFTFSHGAGDNLAMIQDMFSEAKMLLYRDKDYRQLMKYYGYIGRITNYEIQLCGNNGFHPHTHDLEFLDEDLNVNEIQEIYADYWLKYLDAVGLSARSDISVSVLGYRGVGDYITKMGCEMTLGNFTKNSRKGNSLSPFQTLAMYHKTKNYFYAVNWLEYVLNIKRKRIVGWSRGLKDKLGIIDVDDVDETVSIEDMTLPLIIIENPRDIDKLKPWQWRTLKECLSSGMLEEVENLLKTVRILYHVNKIGLKRYNDMLNC